MSKKNIIRIIISVLLVPLLILAQKHIPSPFTVIPFLCVYALIGGDILIRAVKNLFSARLLDENFLMAVATVGAFIIGEYFEGVAVMIFYQAGELFQSYATDKSRKSVAELMNNCPNEVTVIRGGNQITVYPEEVQIGELILVKAGERVAIDGEVIEGSASLDMKALTGESIPTEVKVGDKALSGAINLNGVLTIKTQKQFYDSTMSKILQLVENASAQKAKAENFISKFAKYYTPCVCALAVIIAIVGSLITKNVQHWAYVALSFLVISCPCALVISVPMGFFGGIGSCSRRGVLVKGGNYLELLDKADIFLFDKTGTLTKGEFSVREVNALKEGYDLLQIASNLEQYSNHPIARAITLAKKPSESGFEITEIAGSGIVAKKGESVYLCGNKTLLKQNGVNAQEYSGAGSAVYIAKDSEFLGYVVVSDSLKASTKNAISQLKKQGASCTILSGDSEQNVLAIASESGVNEHIAGLLPHQKVEILEQRLKNKAQKSVVCFVGDGINDAPALMRADVGVAMGALGSDSAIEASDVVVMNDDLEALVTAKKIAKKTVKIVKQNVVLSLSVKFLVLLLCTLGIPYPMWFAVFADVGVAFLAILNSLRTLNCKA